MGATATGTGIERRGVPPDAGAWTTRRRPLHVMDCASDGRYSAARYWWDVETGMLSARVARGAPVGASAAVHVAGDDGSWLSLDVAGGRLRAVEVAVWPRVQRVHRLVAPVPTGGARLLVAEAAVEVNGRVSAWCDAAARCYRFRVGSEPAASVLRAGADVLLEATAEGRLAGVWLLNVPPTPAHRDHDDRPH